MTKILLKELLKRKRLSYRKAEELTSVSKSALCDIANGEIDPKLSTLEQIAKGLNVKIRDFIESDYL